MQDIHPVHEEDTSLKLQNSGSECVRLYLEATQKKFSGGFSRSAFSRAGNIYICEVYHREKNEARRVLTHSTEGLNHFFFPEALSSALEELQ